MLLLERGGGEICVTSCGDFYFVLKIECRNLKQKCCYWRGTAERFVSLPVGIFGLVLKTEWRYLKQKSVAIEEERFVSLPVDSPPPLLCVCVCVCVFVLKTECRCLTQKSVGWRKGLFLCFLLLCFEDGMQIPETKECC